MNQSSFVVRALSVGAFALLVSASAGCAKDAAPPTPPGTNGAGTPNAVTTANGTAVSQTTTTSASVGTAAPDFTLKDLDGKDVSLSSFKGKVVVLEWFNPGCPFVNKAHTKGSLMTDAKKHEAEGVVWLAINSGAAGKQGAELGDNTDAKKRFGLDHPILLDQNGSVGHLYGATNTPHMFIVDKTGKLVYSGAIDNSPDAEGQSPQGGTLVNYVDVALEDLAAGRPVKTATTKPYGCGVKYGS